MKDIEQWTNDNPIGKAVDYQSIIGKSPLTPTQIKSKPWELSPGAWIVKVKGKSGGVSVNHVFDRQAGSTGPSSDTFIATAERQVSNAMGLLGKAIIDRDKVLDENSALREALEGIEKIMVCIGGPLNDNKQMYSDSQLKLFREFQEIIENATNQESE